VKERGRIRREREREGENGGREKKEDVAIGG